MSPSKVLTRFVTCPTRPALSAEPGAKVHRLSRVLVAVRHPEYLLVHHQSGEFSQSMALDNGAMPERESIPAPPSATCY